MSITNSSAPKRLRRSQEASRENILSAAEAILKADGPQNLKLVEVAKAAGVVNATVLHHFGSIGELELTGESRRLTLVQEAVQQVISARPQDETLPSAALENFILICISVALGVGLFGATLSALLGKPEVHARDLALQLISLQIKTALSGQLDT